MSTVNAENPYPDTPAAPLRWGILATGLIARWVTGDLKLTGHTVTAVGSRTLENAQKFADEFGIPNAHGSYEDLVNDPEVDIVYVATPHPMHHDNAALALRAGKHVLVEKAFTINAGQARDLADLGAERGLLVLEAMWTRWLPHMIELRKLLAAGVIGEVRALIADHTQQLPEDPAHRLNALELGGGALLDLGVYPISFAYDVFGTEPVAIEATATKKATGADAETSIILRYPEGRSAVLYTASTVAGPNTAVIIGSKGRVEIARVFYQPTSFRVYDSNDNLLRSYETEIRGSGRQYQCVEAERLIAAGKTSSDILPVSESVAIMATMDQIREKIGLRYPGE